VRGSSPLVGPGRLTRLVLVAAVLAAAAVSARSAAAAPPQSVASWVAPRLNAYWSFVFAKDGLTYRNPPYYYWYNRPGYGWLRTPRECDIYRKRDGLIWAGFSREYAPNSFYCSANDNFYFDWSLWKTLRRGAAVVVAAHEWGHHVQHLLVWPERERVTRRLYANYELMADCYAGAFVRHERDLGELSSAEIGDARRLLESFGDVERIPWSRVRSHGTRADRRRWFARGYGTGDPEACAKLFGRI
jgi:predicted metalloprotease